MDLMSVISAVNIDCWRSRIFVFFINVGYAFVSDSTDLLLYLVLIFGYDY